MRTKNHCSVTLLKVWCHLITLHDDVISFRRLDTEGLTNCNHEEADSRLFLNVRHATAQDLKKVIIRTVDTDVVVLAVANVHNLQTDALWVSFGVGKNQRFLDINAIASKLTREKCVALPFFRASTGCDTTSYFCGRGKKTAFQAWNNYLEVTTVFISLSNPQNAFTDEQLHALERFVIMCSRTSTHSRVNAARQALFSQGRSIEAIPPTQAALEQHSRRAAYHAGQVWGRTLDTMQDLPSPADWGWQLSNSHKWVPTWTVLPEASKICKELIMRGCKRACRGLCKCTKADLPCTGSVSMCRELLPGLNCYIQIHTRYNNNFCLYL